MVFVLPDTQTHAPQISASNPASPMIAFNAADNVDKKKAHPMG
jgi:hypothetical protein